VVVAVLLLVLPLVLPAAVATSTHGAPPLACLPIGSTFGARFHAPRQDPWTQS